MTLESLSAGVFGQGAMLLLFRWEMPTAFLQPCEREQIILIDGYKMLRMELQARQARPLEWNGVHSWVTSLFQWCSKRQINPANCLCKIQSQTCGGDSYKTTGTSLRHWGLTHIQYVRKCSHKSTADIVNSRKHTSNCRATSNNVFFLQTFIVYTGKE